MQASAGAICLPLRWQAFAGRVSGTARHSTTQRSAAHLLLQTFKPGLPAMLLASHRAQVRGGTLQFLRRQLFSFIPHVQIHHPP